MKKAVYITLTLALVACSVAVLAQEPGAPPPAPPFGRPGGGGMMTCPAMALVLPPMDLVDRAEPLQLTDDQKAKLKDTLTKAEEALAPLRRKSMEATRALRQAVFAPDLTAEKLAQLGSDAVKAEAPVLKAEANAWMQIRGILSADQLTKLQDLMTRRQGGGGGGGRGNRRGGAGGGQPAPPPPGQ